jgi:hypothetical protein
MIVTFLLDWMVLGPLSTIGCAGGFYAFRASLVSWPNLSKSAELRRGLMALASSGGYSVEHCSVSLPLGMMMEALGMRGPKVGRLGRDLLGPSCSDSETEEELDEKTEEETEVAGDLAPVELVGFGRGGLMSVDKLAIGAMMPATLGLVDEID